MPRYLTFLLAPLWICSILSTLAILSRIMGTSSNSGSGYSDYTHNENNGDGASVGLDYVMGRGAPPPSLSLSLSLRKRGQHQQQKMVVVVEKEAEQERDERIVEEEEIIEDGDGEEDNDDGSKANNVGGLELEMMEEEEPQLDDEAVEAEVEGEIEEDVKDDYQAPADEDDNGNDDDDDDPRPRKRPKGQRWHGWSSNANKKQQSHTTSTATLPINTVGYPWWRKSKLCFEVDYICHERAENTWFYYSPPEQSNNDNEGLQPQQHDVPFQPTMELKSAAAKYDGGKDTNDKRISIKVFSSSPSRKRKDVCDISSSPTHVVLQSLFNDMIGEFYSRTLLRLYQFMIDDKTGGNGSSATNNGKTRTINGDNGKKEEKKLLPWEEDLQFYVHIPYGNKQMLDGHKLLLSGMLSDPESKVAKSLVDLFVNEDEGEEEEAAADANGGGDDNDCQCYEKMVFCGYDIYTHPIDVLSKDLEPAPSDDDQTDDDDDDHDVAESNDDANNGSDTNEAGAISRTTTTFNYDVKYTLWAAGKLDKSEELDTGSCGRASGTKGEEYHCKEWDGLQTFLSTNFVKHYPTLEKLLVEQRRGYLLEKGVIDDGYKGDTKEYTVIGLTQRTYRRSWINLPDIIKECAEKASFLERRAVCVEVNVENTSSPFEQLLLHRSLDVMIGVHGAQLTQAILLPPHAHVLELLPWIPSYIRGKWVQTTHGPTPLGVIFHNTHLNHVGFSLTRTSVPMCEGVNEEALQLCFMRHRKKFIWENRDFTVDVEPMLQYIENFVLFGREKERTCDELKDRLDERFVMYNIWCTKPSYWYPTVLEGEKTCNYGADYAMDHTDPMKKDAFFFDSREACCGAFPVACQVEGGKSKKEQKHNNPSIPTLSVFHNYHELSPEQKETTAVMPRGKTRRGKKGGRRKEER